MEKRQRIILILILGLLSAIGPFSIDMYLPGFPVIAKSLHTSVDSVSYSLASFFIGVCLGQLLCGPLLDRFGRKIPICIGLLLYIAASAGCAFSHSIWTLVAFRFFQALGGSVGMVAPRAIVRDSFKVEESAKIYSLLILILGVSPILAPTAGSFIIAGFGWNYVFLVLGILATIMLISVFLRLPESWKPDPSFSLKPIPILKTYLFVLKNPNYYTYALAGGISSAGLFAYLSGSPFVFMKYYSLNEQEFSKIFALIAIGLIGFSQLNNWFLRKYSSIQLMQYVLLFQTIIGSILVTGTILNILGLYSTIFLIFLFLSCQGICFPNAAALSMAPFEKEAGTASALMGAMQMALGSVASGIVGLLKAETAIPMTSVMAVCTFLGLLIFTFGTWKIQLNTKKKIFSYKYMIS